MNETPLPPPQPSTADFGPDHTKTDTKEPPKVNQKNPPRKSPIGNLGMNKKPRSPVRKLTEDDREKIESLYVFAGGMLMPFRMSTAQAFATAAEPCSHAWLEIAEKNDNVRRRLLAAIEGGVWSKLFAAHLPILMTLLPENAVPNLWRMMTTQSNEDIDDE